jgi:hypothetical protein
MFDIFKNKSNGLHTNWIVFIFILLTFIIRLSVFYSTVLFSFSDYGAYLSMSEKIRSGDKVFLQSGNFFFTISYLGYFAKYILGSLDYFFLFNCLCGSIIGFLMFYILKKVFHSTLAGIISIILYIFYTEFMVFSSVFYTPILMIFLLSVFVMFLSFYYRFAKPIPLVLSLVGLVLIFLLTFFFKPELLYFPIFLIVFSFFFVRKDKVFMFRSLALAFILLGSYFLFNSLKIISRPEKNVISNDFIFFGHTNYGGDGGEGSFVYPENKVRYEKALAVWCEKNNITQPDVTDRNKFQLKEIFKFVKTSPFAWIKLQFTKFFRTFGVVPETTSFMILYTGLTKGNLWLTSIIVVAPVALIILLFVSFFNISALKKLFISEDKRLQDSVNKHFLYVYFLLFFYYIIATVFFGQYSERYRLPVMVVFIIPLLGYFIASFDRKQFFNRGALTIKGVVIVLFITIWLFQANKAISNKERLKNAIESVKGVHGID